MLKQIYKLVFGHLGSNRAKEFEVDKQARTFSQWSHVVSLFFPQLSHALSMNDVCDTLSNSEDSILLLT